MCHDKHAPQVTATADPPSLPDLVARARGGDAGAFEQLYHRHSPRAWVLALRLTGNHADAADLLQETFIAAWEALPGFREEAAFATWLHRIMVHRGLNGRRAEVHREGSEAPDGAEAVAPLSSDALRLDLESAIRRLPDGARQVLVLHEIEGYKLREIAALLSISVGTVKSQLHRARSMMLEYLNR